MKVLFDEYEVRSNVPNKDLLGCNSVNQDLKITTSPLKTTRYRSSIPLKGTPYPISKFPCLTRTLYRDRKTLYFPVTINMSNTSTNNDSNLLPDSLRNPVVDNRVPYHFRSFRDTVTNLPKNRRQPFIEHGVLVGS